MNDDLRADENYNPFRDDGLRPIGVRIIDYKDELKQIVPMGELQEDVAHHGLKMGYWVSIHLDVTVAANETHARQIIRQFGEEVRLKAARDLGLRPIWDAYERQQRADRSHITLLEQQNRSLKEALGNLQMQLDEIRRPEEGPDGTE